jgi:FkbM family methyltransferase
MRGSYVQIRIAYRRARVLWRQLKGSEPVLRRKRRVPLEFHGTDYGGWPIVPNSLNDESVVVDIGLGEDISFSESLMRKYGCSVYGFDPTPKSIEYVRKRRESRFHLFEVGVAAKGGEATFYLPNNDDHVSGSLFRSTHLGSREIKVPLVPIDSVPELIGTRKLDLIKIDIEGAEFDLLESPAFATAAAGTDQICVEFHHRWPEFGKARTDRAVQRLEQLGFAVAWVSSSNEEVLFVRNGAFE